MNLNPIAWPGNAIRLIARLVSDGLNQTRPVTVIQEYPISVADVDIAVVPKGRGGFSVSTTDGTIAGGNKRGLESIDLQRNRTIASQVASGALSSLLGGTQNTAAATGSCVVGAAASTANGQYSIVIGGIRGLTRGISGYVVSAASTDPISTAAQGYNQLAFLILARQTTDATPTVLASNSAAADASNQLTLSNTSAYAFRATVIAGVTNAGDTRAWEFLGVIKRGATAATTSFVGNVIKNNIAYDAGASTWDVALTVNTTLGCLTVTVTGQAATTIRWVCKIETTEMTY